MLLVCTRQWDVLGRSVYQNNFGEFMSSAALAAVELLLELFLLASVFR